MNHLLLERAFFFPTERVLQTEGWAYRKDIGAWVDADEPEILMVTGDCIRPYGTQTPSDPDSPKPLEPREPTRRIPMQPRPKPRPMSKKCDIETGEDMKGE